MSLVLLPLRLEVAAVVKLVQVPRVGVVKVGERQEDGGADPVAGLAVGDVLDARGQVVLIAPVVLVDTGVSERGVVEVVLGPDQAALLEVLSSYFLELQCPVLFEKKRSISFFIGIPRGFRCLFSQSIFNSLVRPFLLIIQKK